MYFFYLCHFKSLSRWLFFSNTPACPLVSQGNHVFFLTVYLKNWEYSQSLLSEETLLDNSCESPLLPPLLPPSLFLLLSFFLPHFYIFLFWCLVALFSVFDTKQRGLSSGATVQTNSIWWAVLWWKVILWVLVIPPICASGLLHSRASFTWAET